MPTLQILFLAFSIVATAVEGAFVETFWLTGQFISGNNSVRVLLPDDCKFPGSCASQSIPAVFLLTVEAGPGTAEFGDGIQVMNSSGAIDMQTVAAISVAYPQPPWYADHATNTSIRQESYLLQQAMPELQNRFPFLKISDGSPSLLSFSKGGFGALTLLLRHPESFSVAVGFDSPWTQSTMQDFGMAAVYGSEVSYRNNYAPITILPALGQQPAFQGVLPRFGVLGTCRFGPAGTCGATNSSSIQEAITSPKEGNGLPCLPPAKPGPGTCSHTQDVMRLLDILGMPYTSNTNVTSNHAWNGGWFDTGLTMLFQLWRKRMEF